MGLFESIRKAYTDVSHLISKKYVASTRNADTKENLIIEGMVRAIEEMGNRYLRDYPEAVLVFEVDPKLAGYMLRVKDHKALNCFYTIEQDGEATRFRMRAATIDSF